MPALFRCLNGHLWEDVFDAPSLVEGKIRCPICDKSGVPEAKSSQSRLRAPSQIEPSPAGQAAGPDVTRTLQLPAIPPGVEPGGTIVRSTPANRPGQPEQPDVAEASAPAPEPHRPGYDPS